MINLFCFLFLTSAAIGVQAEGSSGPSSAALDHLVRLLQPLESFSARFDQTLLSSEGSRLQSVQGEMKAKRPGLFRWETEDPLPQTLVSDGEQVWIHDPDLEQVTIQKLDQQISSTPALLLSGEIDRINEVFEVRYSRPPESGVSPTPDFILTPRAPDSLFEWLSLNFSTDGVLSGMSLVDTLGQKTLLRFLSPQFNPDLAMSEFHFQIPDGVDVIRQGDPES